MRLFRLNDPVYSVGLSAICLDIPDNGSYANSPPKTVHIDHFYLAKRKIAPFACATYPQTDDGARNSSPDQPVPPGCKKKNSVYIMGVIGPKIHEIRHRPLPQTLSCYRLADTSSQQPGKWLSTLSRHPKQVNSGARNMRNGRHGTLGWGHTRNYKIALIPLYTPRHRI